MPVSPDDYSDLTRTLMFSSDMRTQTLEVMITDDSVVEGHEEFDVRLSGESVSESMSVATVTIRDDDRGEFTVEAVNDTISEGEDVSFRRGADGWCYCNRGYRRSMERGLWR